MVPYTPYYHHFEVAPVCNKDLVNYFPHQSALYQLRPHCHVLVLPSLLEVEEEVHQTEPHQQVSNLLAERVLGFSDVLADFSYKYGILVLEAC